MRKIAIVTVGRSDFGIYQPVLKAIAEHPKLQPQVIASGTHLVASFGKTESMILGAGFNIDARVDMLLAHDSPEAIATSMGLGTIGFAREFTRLDPDIVLLLGDRFEMHAAASASIPLRKAVAHIHGGEETVGAMDNAIRHSISKLSHIHFTSTMKAATRLERMGENPASIHVTGAPSLDNLFQVPLLDRSETCNSLGIDGDSDFVLVTYHSETLSERSNKDFEELLRALENFHLSIVFTRANADQGGRQINALLDRFVAEHKRAVIADNLGTQRYFSAMKHASAMIGNSSSGIIEAASFGLPVVNIADRQKGRERNANVLDVGANSNAIIKAIQAVLENSFKERAQESPNIYGDGTAGKRIADILAKAKLDMTTIRKEFHE